jgi:hypothetical protein
MHEPRDLGPEVGHDRVVVGPGAVASFSASAAISFSFCGEFLAVAINLIKSKALNIRQASTANRRLRCVMI